MFEGRKEDAKKGRKNGCMAYMESMAGRKEGRQAGRQEGRKEGRKE